MNQVMGLFQQPPVGPAPQAPFQPGNAAPANAGDLQANPPPIQPPLQPFPLIGGQNAFAFNGPHFDAILQFENIPAPGGGGGVNGPPNPPEAEEGAAPGDGPLPGGAAPWPNLVGGSGNVAHLVLTFPPMPIGGESDPNDPQVIEARRARQRTLDQAQIARAPAEIQILNMWHAFCPSLRSARFEMERERFVVWTRFEDGAWSSEYTPSRNDVMVS